MDATIQILSLDAIKVDRSLQSRVETYPHYMHEFSEAMLRGDEFPPITTFFDGRKYWLSDGFHRYGARKALARSDRKFEGIRAEVFPGSKFDAIAFSAAANQKFSIPRTKQDIERAVFMLRDLDEWVDASCSVIANYIGARHKIVSKHSQAYFEKYPSRMPAAVKSKDGKLVPTADEKGPLTLHERNRRGKKKCYVTRFDGREISLGTDRKEAEEKLAVLREKHLVPQVSDRDVIEPLIGPLVAAMKERGIYAVRIALSNLRPIIEITPK